MTISKNQKVLILSHYSKRAIYGGGPPQEVRNYLLPVVKQIFYIEHPFPYADDKRSSMTIYENGIIKKQIFTFSKFGPQIIFYILDFLITLYFLWYLRTKIDLCVALDNLNTFSVLPFKKLGAIKKLVFYTIDNTPYRFENRILNSIYHLIDKIACYNSDAIWILSPIMINTRKKKGISPEKSGKNIILPMGANLEGIKLLPINKIRRHQMIFVGILLEKQGLQVVIEALPKILKKINDAKLIIVGSGEYQNKLKKIAANNKVTKFVDFKGFVEKQSEVEKLLCESALGIATYKPDPDNFTYFTDPGKPKLYLGCGLPVVITDVPSIAKVIEKKGAGSIVNYSSEDVAEKIIELLLNNKKYETFRKNAINLSKNYNTNTLIKNAISNTP